MLYRIYAHPSETWLMKLMIFEFRVATQIRAVSQKHNEWLEIVKFSTFWQLLYSRSSSHIVKAVDQAWGCHWDRFDVTLSPVNWSFNFPTTRVLLYWMSRAKISETMNTTSVNCVSGRNTGQTLQLILKKYLTQVFRCKLTAILNV